MPLVIDTPLVTQATMPDSGTAMIEGNAIAFNSLLTRFKKILNQYDHNLQLCKMITGEVRNIATRAEENLKKKLNFIYGDSKKSYETRIKIVEQEQKNFNREVVKSEFYETLNLYEQALRRKEQGKVRDVAVEAEENLKKKLDSIYGDSKKSYADRLKIVEQEQKKFDRNLGGAGDHHT